MLIMGVGLIAHLANVGRGSQSAFATTLQVNLLVSFIGAGGFDATQNVWQWGN